MAIELPMQKRKVAEDLAQQTILLFGQPKIGKSTFAAGFDGAIFLGTEDGQRHIECYHIPIRSWEDFIEAFKLLKTKEASRYKTIVIDTVDLLYSYCREYAGKKHGFEHESDESYGKGYDLVKNEFQRGLNRLAQLGKGLILISHSVEREVKTRVTTITKTMCTLPKSARDIILPMVSIIIYAGFKYVKDEKTGEKIEKRVAMMKPSETLEAGDRTGRLPESLPLRASKFIEAYKRGKKVVE